MAGLHPALCQPRAGQRNRGPNFPNSSTTAQLRISVINTRLASPASTIVRCENPAALGASLGVGPAPKAVCQSESATPPLAPFLRGRVQPGRYSSRPCVIFALRAVLAQLRSVLGKNAAKPSGRPGYGRPGRWRRVCQDKPATHCAVRPHQRSGVVLLFGGQCLFAKTVVPRINVSASLTGWAVPAQAPEAVCPHTAPVSSAAPGSL